MRLDKIFKKSETKGEQTKLGFSLSSLRGRIITLVTVPLIFLLVVAGVSLFQINKLSIEMFKALNETVPAVSTSKQLQLEINRINDNLSLAFAYSAKPDELSLYLDKVDGAKDRYLDASAIYKNYQMAPQANLLRSSLFEIWDEVKGPLSECLKMLQEKKFNDATKLFEEEVRPKLGAISEMAQNVELNNQDTIEITKTDAALLVKASRLYSIGGALLAFLVSLTASLLFATSISRSFANIGTHLNENGVQVATAAAQLALASQKLASAATEQAASLVETSTSLEETSAIVKKNSDNSNNAATMSSESKEKAESGRHLVEKMIHSMDEINESNNNIMTQINHSNVQIGQIVQVIQEIGNKTKVINEIVFQTKLLSFNASVEAARAGEHGKGFAVVAAEVGKLAEMSGTAAKEITDLLSGSVHKVESIISETKTKVEKLVADGKEKVSAGSTIARLCGATLVEIVTNVTNVSQIAVEISIASGEQAQGVQEITKAINQLDQVSHQNTAISEEAAASATELSAQAESLQAVVSQLVILIHGAGTVVNEARGHRNATESQQA